MVITLIAGLILFFYFTSKKGSNIGDLNFNDQPQFSISASPSVLPANPSPSKSSTSSTPKPLAQPTQELSEQTLRWNQLTGEAYCELTGEIKYLNSNTYDNQDARFIYRGIDHPSRGIVWVVSPNDGLDIGPDIFAQMPLPDGISLIGVSLPETQYYKKYELTASINYGRLVDGNIKVYTKQCVGKTIVVLP